MSQVFQNNAKSTLALGIGPTDTILPVVDASSFPVITGSNYALVTLQYQNLIEIVKLIAPGKVTNNLIVDPAGRGQEGTTPLAFTLGSRVECRITKGTLDLIVATASAATTAEANRATAAEGAEAVTRAAADVVLQTNINNEASTRSSAVSAEALTRGNADTTLQNNINSEVTNRNSAISSAVSAEAILRSGADTTLQTNIDNEALTRATNDTAEYNRAIAEEAYLQGQITGLSGGVLPEIINGTSGTTYSRTHTGNVLIIYNSGIVFQPAIATLGYQFYFNGALQNSWTGTVNYQVAMTGIYYKEAAVSGVFTFACNQYSYSIYMPPQFIIYYL